MRTVFLLMCASSLLFAVGCGKEQTVITHPSEHYLSQIIAHLDYTASHIAVMQEAADTAAERLSVGGHIFITDDESLFLSGEDKERISEAGVAYTIHEQSGGFVAEACDRAGGLGAIKPLPKTGEIAAGDVVLAGTLDLAVEQQARQLTNLREKGALVIVFGSPISQIAACADYLIDNGLETGLIPGIILNDGKEIGPSAGIANVVNMWTFTAELVAALTRQGKMPTFWQSMFVPGAEARNERIAQSAFETDMTIDPVSAGVLGRQYVQTVRGYLKQIQENELPKFIDAGKLCADTIKGGGEIVTYLIGHFMASQARMPGFPEIFTILDQLKVGELVQETLDKGDVLLHVGYSYYPEAILKLAREREAKVICVSTPGPKISGEGEPVEPDKSLVNIYIDPYWKHGDAVVEVPGYDTKIIPPSGVVMATCYWMLIGETLANLPQ